MSIQDRFLAYANAFEVAFDSNDWSGLEQFFTHDASYDNGMGDVAKDRAAVLVMLESAVDGFDRLMDTRVLDFIPPTTEGDTVTMSWTAHYSKAGVPDLQFGGTEFAQFEGDRIARLWDELDTDALETLSNWLGIHGASLGK
jgi:hypothetical protein